MIPEIEKASSEKIKAFQEEKLQELIAYIAEKSPYYKRVFKEHDIKVSDIRTLEDLAKLPVTTKEELQHYNDDFLCVPKSQIIDFVTTSGTLGDPVILGQTDKDLDRLAHNEAISLACSGVGENDIIQMTTTMDRRFMAGLAYFLGVRKLGAGIIRVGAGIPELQWDTILKFRPTYLIVVPSFLLKLIQYAETHGIDINTSGVKGAICIGESLRNQDFSLNVLADKIKSKWNIELYSTYASTEMSTAFAECSEQRGGHHHPELIVAEILDDNDQAVADGQEGELTITTLGVEAMPLLRFKTGDIVVAHTSPCACGRNTMRLGPVIGRKKQMIKYKGTTLYPPAMDNLLNDFEEVEGYVFEIYQNEIGTDEILIKIASSSADHKLMQAIKDHFRSKLRVSPNIEICPNEEIQKLRMSKLGRKPISVIDKRQ
ncbi:AMP-binding protein [Zobellia galactanivorans]|uniref:Phenylacetate-coenzyme A ligase n=1 Tax=Zobellia galactanivorans (strain DSM 12802 / CCUG 47099 / CIP 106680 / NCIMB 13871 / Dsij) TaxID=63186 RepID=G0LBI5_ZOBGA|nr:AMP-binding protein [Zobellia galactanivorans]MBU3026433.1 AMP-binding protein [Zobellia galactanivorans]MDO6810034.1 AMP-binding protein [Zobellia galactanivorans]CAZ96183.1 Phenylacetate-coenzyme A ligase [Zobellia galactanivorans]